MTTKMISARVLGPAKSIMRAHAHPVWIGCDGPGLKIEMPDTSPNAASGAVEKTLLVRFNGGSAGAAKDAAKLALALIGGIRLENAVDVDDDDLDNLEAIARVWRAARKR